MGNLKRLFGYSEPRVASATVLVLGGIIIACIAWCGAYQIKIADDTVEVTGSAKEAVVADHAKWVIHLETQTSLTDQQSGFNRLQNASDAITAYLREKGFEDVEAPAAVTYPNYTYPQYSEPILTDYTVARDIIVQSDNIDGVADLANNIAPLTGEGYTVSLNTLELTYQKLDEMRVKLLSEAIADAKDRAEAIARESGRSVGALRSSSSGVVQVLAAGSVDISDYGMYDTQSKNKDVMVTVRAQFKLK
ncbi:MAG: SIMPL domain-containing protein [Candidatus Colwellbacteria bacterium]|nr:SIMPL domain-containing protein [Candidatus Colwellbacteria bacterium]